jgi:glycosyltransferase involved in cell wall biosynthesis
MMRVAVTAPDPAVHSGLSDYARLLAAALEEQGYTAVSPGSHDCAVLNFTPYGAGLATGWLRAPLEARSLARGGRPLVTVFHEVFVRPDQRLRMRVFERLQRWAHRRLVRTSAAVVVSDSSRAAALAALVPDAAPAHVVPVGANVPLPPAPPVRAPAPVVVTFGLLHPLRDLETLVRAAPLVRAQVPDVEVVVVGDLRTDPERARRLRDEAAALDAPVTFTGPLDADDVARQLARARVFVSTYVESLSFGSGTLAAALGHGLAVVAFEGIDLAPELEPGRTLLTARREPGPLAETLVAALGARGDGPAAAGRGIHDAYLSWSAIGARIAALLP